MPGQPFLLTVAGLALSVAGFAGLMAAFRRDASWTPTDLWRLRGIVRLSFLCMFLALAPVPIFTLVQNEALAVAISSLLVASVYAWEARLAHLVGLFVEAIRSFQPPASS
jgi:hypothetical protein